MKTFLATALFLLLPAVCFAQRAEKIPVKVTQSGDDQVGPSVALALKEAIRGSQRFYLVEDLNRPAIGVYVNSDGLVIPGLQKEIYSSIGVVFVYDSATTMGGGIYFGSAYQVCAREKSESCAKNILPNIDKVVQDLRTNWPDLWKQL